MLVELRPGDHAIRNKSGEKEDDGQNKTEKPSLNCSSTQGKKDDIRPTCKNASNCLATEDCSHVGWRELASNTENATLEDGGVDVDENHREQGDHEEGVLPGVRVNLLSKLKSYESIY